MLTRCRVNKSVRQWTQIVSARGHTSDQNITEVMKTLRVRGGRVGDRVKYYRPGKLITLLDASERPRATE